MFAFRVWPCFGKGKDGNIVHFGCVIDVESEMDQTPFDVCTELTAVSSLSKHEEVTFNSSQLLKRTLI